MTRELVSAVRSDDDLLRANLRFYDPLWRRSRLASPERFNTWPLVHSLLRPSQSRLEVAPGLRPRLPIAGTSFLDASPTAIAKLREHGAQAELGVVSRLPFADGAFDLVAAFDIVEHVDDDDAVLSELTRVGAASSTLLLSVPLHPERWTAFDELVGHRRRYEPQHLLGKLADHGLSVVGTAVYGMQPRSPWLMSFGLWWLTHLREAAIWWYDRVILRFGARFQEKLELTPGVIDLAEVDEVLLACRKI
ncbi:MAG TPA: methyltransferase domain-containing protein [Polyangiaceae bacterium]